MTRSEWQGKPGYRNPFFTKKAYQDDGSSFVVVFNDENQPIVEDDSNCAHDSKEDASNACKIKA